MEPGSTHVSPTCTASFPDHMLEYGNEDKAATEPNKMWVQFQLVLAKCYEITFSAHTISRCGLEACSCTPGGALFHAYTSLPLLPPPLPSSAILGRLTTPMKFKVRDKEHTLGVLQMTLSELTSHKGHKWYPLQPHRKSHDKRLHENQGELLVGCWVSEYKMVSPEKPSPSTSRTSSNEDLRKKEHRKERFSFHGRTPSGGRVKHLPHEVSPTCTEKPLASSDYEIHSKRVLPSFQSDTNLRFASFGLHDDQSEMKQVTPEQSPLDSSSLQGETENFLEPEVTGISPNECPVEGNQRVILRGSNLGESRSDVVRVVVADVDCTSTLEYFSPGEPSRTGSQLPTTSHRCIIVLFPDRVHQVLFPDRVHQVLFPDHVHQVLFPDRVHQVGGSENETRFVSL